MCTQMSTSREIQIISNSEVLSQDQYLHQGCLSSSIFYKVGYVYCLFDWRLGAFNNNCSWFGGPKSTALCSLFLQPMRFRDVLSFL